LTAADLSGSEGKGAVKRRLERLDTHCAVSPSLAILAKLEGDKTNMEKAQ